MGRASSEASQRKATCREVGLEAEADRSFGEEGGLRCDFVSVPLPQVRVAPLQINRFLFFLVSPPEVSTPHIFFNLMD